MAMFRPPEERPKRLAKSCWPARDCWPDVPRTGRVTKAQKERKGAQSIRERRTGLARQLEKAHKLYEVVLEEKARMKACNDAIVAAAGQLGVMRSISGMEGVRRGLGDRTRAWERYEEAWDVLTTVHIDVALALSAFETGPERLLLGKDSLDAVRTFFITMGEYAFANPQPRISDVPGTEEEEMLSVIEYFHERHLDRIVRALDLLPVDLQDVRRRTRIVRGDDGMTVQERYIATQNALVQAFPRRSIPPLSDAAKERLKGLDAEVDASVLKASQAYGPFLRHCAWGKYSEEYKRLIAASEAQDADQVAQLYLKEGRRLYEALAPPEAGYVDA